MEKNEYPEPTRIPVSYKNGINLLVASIPTEYALQGILFSIPPVFIAYYLVTYVFVNLEVSTKLVIIIFSAAPFGILGFTGVNGGTFTAFLADYFRFMKNRRTAYYNPRIKTEYIPDAYMDNDSTDLFSREGLHLVFQSIRSSISVASDELQRQQAEINASSADNVKNLYFTEDEGIIEAPWEYKTEKERKRILREQKKREKAERKKKKK